MSKTIIPALTFHAKSYIILEELINDMAKYWSDGKQLLFDGILRDHIRRIDPSLANSCAAAEKEHLTKPEEDNKTFLKWLCKYPGINELYWLGKNYGTLKNLGTVLSTNSADERLNNLLMYMLHSQLLSIFIKSSGGTQDLIDKVKYLERAVNKTDSMFAKQNALKMLTVFLNGNYSFHFDGQVFRIPADLANYLQQYADISKSALSRKISPLFQDDYNFDPDFEAWIVMHGYQHELTLWKGRFQENQGDSLDDEFILDEAQEEIQEARFQSDSEFSNSVAGFEDKFVDLLKNYGDRIEDPTAFNALMGDYFPQYKIQTFLLMALYRMDIVKAIMDTEEINELTVARFEKRLVKDYGVKEAFAKWAVYEWGHCYGDVILHKKCTIQLELE